MNQNQPNDEGLPSWVPTGEGENAVPNGPGPQGGSPRFDELRPGSNHGPQQPGPHQPQPGQPTPPQPAPQPQQQPPQPQQQPPQPHQGQRPPQQQGAQPQYGPPFPNGGAGSNPGMATHDAAQPGRTPPSIDDVALVKRARRAPSSGWRRAVYKVSGGKVNPRESQEGLRYEQLVHAVNQPIRGDYRIAVLSLKGGVGKTTTAVTLGSTLASLRGDRVIAVDANPDLGTLAQRVPQQTASTVRDLLADNDVARYSDVRAHTSQAPSRLEVLASERDPAAAETFNEEEYRGVVSVLQRFYNIIITDCGTGLSHSAMSGVLGSANAIILVSSPAIDGARSAAATLDWLEAHGYGHLAQRAVVVLSSSRPGSSSIDTEQLVNHFRSRTRAVHRIPFDDHLAEGAEVDLELVGKSARMAFVELAATIAEDFSGTLQRTPQ